MIRIAAMVQAAFLLALMPTIAQAHVLDINTARITLRDAHVEVVLSIDFLKLIARTAPPGVDVRPESLVVADEHRLAEVAAKVKQAIEDGVKLYADGAAVGLELRAAPTAQELRPIATAAALSGHVEPLALRLEARSALLSVKSISITTSETLGPVLATFVQPSTRWMSPGGSAAFTVLEPPSAGLQRGTARFLSSRTLAVAGVVLAMAAALWNLVLVLRLRADRRASPGGERG